MDLIEIGKSLGFSKVAIIDTKDIVFNGDFRKYCVENLCGNYDSNYSCPPLCGTFEEMKDRVLKFDKALVLQSNWEIEGYDDFKNIKKAKKMHNKWGLEIRKKLLDNGQDSLMCGASDCSICDECARKKGKECLFPDLMFSCLSAYCIYVKNLCELCDMNYDLGVGKISFFSIICY